MRTRLLITAAMILIAALASGTVIYFTAGDESESTAYVVIGDTAYAVDPATSRTYTRQLERFGGKASVLFDEFNRWFGRLWRGRMLGITIGAIGAFAALILFAIARRMPENQGSNR
jgi:hypothetical protein